MRALSTKQVQKDQSRKPAKHTSFPRSVTSSSGNAVIQRTCPCGGGCPRCEEELPIQTKLKINKPGDIYEQEADRVAEQVMRMPYPVPQSSVNSRPEGLSIQSAGRYPEKNIPQKKDDVKEEEIVQMKRGSPPCAAGSLPFVPPIVHEVLSSPGYPLDQATRAYMEPRFGHDFGRVKVHSGAAAEQSARDVKAHAYTIGHNMVFGAGRFAPGMHEGRLLIAHELAHVVQQGRVQGAPTLVQREPISEYASELAKELAKGQTKTELVLGFVSKWGRNASPFNIAMNYVKLNWKGVSYWTDVRKSAKKGRALLKRIDELESGARALKKATDEQYSAKSKLLTYPLYPLQTVEKVGQMVITNEELEYVEKYYNTAAKIANDAMAASNELRKAIAGWDAVVEQANKNNDYTRASVWDAINDLNLRFNNEGGDFRAYLGNARDRANWVESWARNKQYQAAGILGKWTPEGYQPPEGPF